MTRVEIAHDYVVERAGSERVLLSMHHAFPDARIHTAFYRPNATYSEFASASVLPFEINRIAPLRNHHRAALPLLPTVFGRTTIEADVLVCGTSGWSAGIRTSGRKVLYVHAAARWLHDQEAFLAGRSRLEVLGLRVLESRLREWDRRAMESGDRHLVPSSAMAEDVRAIYGLEASVLAPPVTIDPDGDAREPRPGVGADFVLLPGRIVANKNVRTVVEAFRLRPNDRLVVAGGGPQLEQLRRTTPTNVLLLGPVDDQAMRWLYTRCRAVVSASHESFGLVALEGAMFGKPAVVPRFGGFIDTVIDGVTGVFLASNGVDGIGEAIDAVDALDVEPHRLRMHATQWSEPAFIEGLQRVIAEEAALL